MSKFFINRPIVAMVISILMVILGLVAMSGLPIAQFPNIADPQIQVNATYPGADATTIQQSVATPIEQQMAGVDNMEYMYYPQRQQRHDEIDGGFQHQRRDRRTRTR